MKAKIVSLIAALTLIFTCFVSCSKKQDTADVHVFYYTYSDTYISSVRSALDAALKEDGVTFQDYDGNGNQTTQTEQIQTAITKESFPQTVLNNWTETLELKNKNKTNSTNICLNEIKRNRKISKWVLYTFN